MRAPTFVLIAVFSLACAGDSHAIFPLSGALRLFGIGGKKEREEKKAVVDDSKRSLQERVMKPDLNKEFSATKGSPSANRSVGTRSASSREFSTRAFSAREFYSRDFHGSKAAHLSKSKVDTAEASTRGRNVIPNVDTEAPTTAVAVKSLRDADKSVDSRTASAAGREYLIKGRSQDLYDLEKGVPRNSKPPGYSGDLKQLTIQDVRELLNKNE